jgi:hypothetical protein
VSIMNCRVMKSFIVSSIECNISDIAPHLFYSDLKQEFVTEMKFRFESFDMLKIIELSFLGAIFY